MPIRQLLEGVAYPQYRRLIERFAHDLQRER
jgi:hypothetical protein